MEGAVLALAKGLYNPAVCSYGGQPDASGKPTKSQEHYGTSSPFPMAIAIQRHTATLITTLHNILIPGHLLIHLLFSVPFQSFLCSS